MALRQFPDGYYKQFIPKTGIPARIYKYNSINSNLLSSLKDGYLWFSKPLDFNDPFDCWTALVDFSEPEDYYLLMRFLSGRTVFPVHTTFFRLSTLYIPDDRHSWIVKHAIYQLVTDHGLLSYKP